MRKSQGLASDPSPAGARGRRLAEGGPTSRSGGGYCGAYLQPDWLRGARRVVRVHCFMAAMSGLIGAEVRGRQAGVGIVGVWYDPGGMTMMVGAKSVAEADRSRTSIGTVYVLDGFERTVRDHSASAVWA